MDATEAEKKVRPESGDRSVAVVAVAKQNHSKPMACGESEH